MKKAQKHKFRRNFSYLIKDTYQKLTVIYHSKKLYTLIQQKQNKGIYSENQAKKKKTECTQIGKEE